jgi:DNA-binding response OmpR family regulator
MIKFSEQRKIMVIDDESMIIELITDMFEDEPFVIQSASTGYEALIKIPMYNPDLILLDIKLGGQIDGLQVLQKLKENSKTSNIPVLIVSGKSDLVIEGFNLGAADFIYKPFSKNDLLEAFWKYMHVRPTFNPKFETVSSDTSNKSL